ncbi:MAG: Asp-tRNA(Asn)/Glu-tRNA(Gln) amidotransferase subunit GatC [Bacilli bacterium]|nr:Asp-tRNA(Asn)/Glu-tRNA(Gln) amidotransferase subunit GatC [Bacilli bacterium]
MIEKKDLEKYAEKLMFKMNDEEYKTLQDEFDIILKQMDLIDRIDGISEVEPMMFPFITYKAKLRDDVVKEELTVDEVLSNTRHQVSDQVKVPKVVE